MFTPYLLPGQGFQEFTVYRSGNGVTDTGRPVKGTIEATEIDFVGMLTDANQKEIEQWKQNGHPITHKITSHGAIQKAQATDYLITESGKEFYVQGVKNPGDLNVTIIYYVEERNDVKKRDDAE